MYSTERNEYFKGRFETDTCHVAIQEMDIFVSLHSYDTHHSQYVTECSFAKNLTEEQVITKIILLL